MALKAPEPALMPHSIRDEISAEKSKSGRQEAKLSRKNKRKNVEGQIPQHSTIRGQRSLQSTGHKHLWTKHAWCQEERKEMPAVDRANVYILLTLSEHLCTEPGSAQAQI